MACRDFVTWACKLIASSKTVQTTTLITIVVVIMSALAIAGKATKKAGDGESADNFERDKDENSCETSSPLGAPAAPDYLANVGSGLDQVFSSDRGLDALPTPPLLMDGPRTRYSPPDRKPKDQGLLPKPLKLGQSKTPSDKYAVASLREMLQSDPAEFLGPQNGNANAHDGKPNRYPLLDLTNDKYQESSPKGSHSRKGNANGDSNSEISSLNFANTDHDANFASPDPNLEVSSPTKDGTKSVKSSPFSSLRRKVSSVFTSESPNQRKARHDSTDPMLFSLAKVGEREMSLASVGENLILSPTITRTGKSTTHNASFSSYAGSPGTYNPEQTTSPSTPSTKSPIWKPVGFGNTTKAPRIAPPMMSQGYSTIADSQSSEINDLGGSSPSLTSAENLKDHTFENSPMRGAPVYAYGEPPVYAHGHRKAEKLRETCLQDVFGVNSNAGHHKSLPASTPITGQVVQGQAQPKLRSLTRTLVGNPLKIIVPAPQVDKAPKLSKSKIPQPTKTTGPLIAHTSEPVFEAASTLGHGGHEHKSRQPDEDLDPEAAGRVPRRSVGTSSSKIVSHKKGPKNIRQTFFFEDYHTKLEARVKADVSSGNRKCLEQNVIEEEGNDDEVKYKAKTVSEDDSEHSENSTIIGIPIIRQRNNEMVPDIPEILEMDEASRQNQAALKEEAAHEKEAARQKKRREDYASFKVDELRNMTGTQIVFYSHTDLRPKHPNHLRKWNAKNVHCTKCKGRCKKCNAPCCVMSKACTDSIDFDGQDSDNLTREATEAYHLFKYIKYWVDSIGRDQPTFMECTSCKEYVCPDCCSVCPVFPCHDRTCRKCNPDGQWKCCEYHKKADIPNCIPEYQRHEHQKQ